VAAEELAAMGNVRLLLADALGGAGGGLHPLVLAALAEAMPATGRFLVVANLPYATSGPLLAALLALPRLPDRIVVLVQRELGERLAARAGSREYGGLSAQLQAAFTVDRVRTVPADVFRPRPKVESAVLRLDRRPDSRLADASARIAFQAFVRVLFGQRRKTLRATLARAVAAGGPGPGALAQVDARLLGQRAESLTPTRWSSYGGGSLLDCKGSEATRARFQLRQRPPAHPPSVRNNGRLGEPDPTGRTRQSGADSRQPRPGRVVPIWDTLRHSAVTTGFPQRRQLRP
jgi:16S rRNA A1518/A1519 N6-dimethyltransferase RsmA/KsgA/DIM1 with predicted DNA glycosylase/AP lyase activity